MEIFLFLQFKCFLVGGCVDSNLDDYLLKFINHMDFLS